MNTKTTVFVAAFAMLAGAIAAGSAQTRPSASAGGPSKGALTAPAGAPALVERGQTLYKLNCASCHGATGRGDGPAAAALKPAPRDHTNREYMSKLTDKDISEVIRFGGALKGMPSMPSSPHLKAPDIEALVAYVRSLTAQAKPTRAATKSTR